MFNGPRMTKEMKRIGIISALALAALALTNCATQEIDAPEATLIEKEGVPFEIIASAGQDTRTANDGLTTKWVEGDAVNLFHAVAGGTEYINDKKFTIEHPETGLFNGTVASEPVVGTAYDWYAIYPYDAKLTSINSITADVTVGTNRYLTIGAGAGHTQTQNAVGTTGHLCGSNMPLYGVKKNAQYTGAAPFIQMNQLTSVAAVTITNKTSAAINIASVKLEAPEDIIGTYYLNILGEDVVYTPSGDTYVSNSAVLEVTGGTLGTDGPGSVGVFYIALKPFTAPSGSTISLTVTTEAGDTQTKVFNLTKDYTFSAGKMKTVKMDFTKEHESSLFYQITSVDDITADGKYMIVMPDVSVSPNEYLILKAGAGETGNLFFTNSGFSIDQEGLISYSNPNEKFIWGVQSITDDGQVNFRYSNGSIWYGISASGSDADVKTNSGNGYWTPTLLSSNCFQLTTTVSDKEKYLSRGTSDVAKAYLTSSSSKFDQVETKRARGQYACAWAILKLGASPDPRQFVEMSFSPTEVSIHSDEEFTAPTLTTSPEGLTVTYSSDTPAVATVDENSGEVTIVGLGTAVITATFAGNDDYRPAEASYTISVTPPSTGTDWILVETLDDLVAGEYVITWNNALYLPSDVAAEKNPPVGTGIKVANKQLTNEVSDAMVWTFSGNNTDGFAITSTPAQKTYILNSSSSTTGISVSTSSNTVWKASIHTTKGMALRGSDGSTRNLAVYNSQDWRYYDVSTSNYNGTLRLYKKVITDGKTDAEISYSPNSATVTYGQTWTQPTLNNPYGLTVTYESDATDVATVASDGTISVVGAGTATITASWTEQVIDGVTYRAGSTTFVITVGEEGQTMTIDFERGLGEYTDWSYNNFTRSEAGTYVTPHGGSYYGATTGTATAYLVTKNKVASPISITFWISKTSNNTASSNWKIQVSANGEDWTDVLTRSASDMSRGEWVEVTQLLSDYSDVYVRVYYSGTTAVRAIDDLVLSYN